VTNSLLEVDDLDPARLAAVLDNALAWKADPARVPATLAGKGVAALFEKPSARTRISIEMAVSTLHGHPIYIRPEEVGLDTRESVEDVARTMAGMCVAIAARVFDHRVLERMEAAVDIPIINLLSDRAHPCQALADLLTLREHFNRLEGLRVAYVGDGNNVAASLAFGSALSGVALVVASPEGSSTPTSWRGPAIWAARSSSRVIPAMRCAASTRSTPTCGRRWGRRPSATRGCTRLPASPSTRR
jgi:ornithine carbamoyltransferase